MSLYYTRSAPEKTKTPSDRVLVL